ncbi:cupin domain-containing protein [Ruania halotolerans]|uniref:cupin domain-containing protein n=1 Tax=Ruania halotolerans TaxID=2897773 RepID=UPI001E624EDC|nr:cupin domain-containing protein [Ruania halotolerans]UFU06718.1 cupin domain-containing protein [Ruania halotolerans]
MTGGPRELRDEQNLAWIECGAVLADRLTVHVTATGHEITAGEPVTFDSRQPHRYQNVTDGVVEFLGSVAPPSL